MSYIDLLLEKNKDKDSNIKLVKDFNKNTYFNNYNHKSKSQQVLQHQEKKQQNRVVSLKYFYLYMIF